MSADYDKHDVKLLLNIYEEHSRPESKSVHCHERQNQMIRGWQYIAWCKATDLEEFTKILGKERLPLKS